MPYLELTSEIQLADAAALVIHCSDHRFQPGLREFLDETLGLRSNYDLLAVPGGPQCLAPLPHLPKFAWASRKWIRMLLQAHALKRVILVAHQDCGWYKWLANYEVGQFDARQRQEDDLHRAAQVLLEKSREWAVELYYAGWNSAGHCTIESVAV